MNIACVLRSGGIYGPRWVQCLKAGVERYLPTPHRFVCLSDQPLEGVDVIALEEGWPGWWSKLELFRPGVFAGPVLYMDLDTLPVGDLSEIAGWRGELAMLSDFYQPPRAQSGMMAWTPGERTAAVFERFASDAARAMKSTRGDGEWLHDHAGPVDRLQDLFPGQITSLKVHAHPQKHSGPPQGARLVCGHGRPRFNDPSAGWAHELWKRRTA